MPDVQTPTRADVLMLLTRRARTRYGEALVHLLALREDPYEPQSEPYALYAVAVLRDDDYNMQDADRAATEVSEAVNFELGYAYVTTLYVASEGEYEQRSTGTAVAAQEEGMHLL